ncbi:MAG: hypothetical protein RLZZ142_151 [Verrucomicrobiota bacterium]
MTDLFVQPKTQPLKFLANLLRFLGYRDRQSVLTALLHRQTTVHQRLRPKMRGAPPQEVNRPFQCADISLLASSPNHIRRRSAILQKPLHQLPHQHLSILPSQLAQTLQSQRIHHSKCIRDLSFTRCSPRLRRLRGPPQSLLQSVQPYRFF